MTEDEILRKYYPEPKGGETALGRELRRRFRTPEDACRALDIDPKVLAGDEKMDITDLLPPGVRRGRMDFIGKDGRHMTLAMDTEAEGREGEGESEEEKRDREEREALLRHLEDVGADDFAINRVAHHLGHDRRTAKDEPERFPGRPRPGGGQDPMDRRHEARDKSWPDVSPHAEGEDRYRRRAHDDYEECGMTAPSAAIPASAERYGQDRRGRYGAHDSLAHDSAPGGVPSLEECFGRKVA